MYSQTTQNFRIILSSTQVSESDHKNFKFENHKKRISLYKSTVLADIFPSLLGFPQSELSTVRWKNCTPRGTLGIDRHCMSSTIPRNCSNLFYHLLFSFLWPSYIYIFWTILLSFSRPAAGPQVLWRPWRWTFLMACFLLFRFERINMIWFFFACDLWLHLWFRFPSLHVLCILVWFSLSVSLVMLKPRWSHIPFHIFLGNFPRLANIPDFKYSLLALPRSV